MIDLIFLNSDKNLGSSHERFDSSCNASKISTTDSSIRLIEREAKLKMEQMHHLNFLIISKSHNSLDEEEANNIVVSPCISNNSCMHFKRCVKIQNCPSLQKQIKENNISIIEDSLDDIKDDEKGEKNFSLLKDEKQTDSLKKNTKNTQFLNSIKEKLLTFKQQKIARILSEKSRSKKYLEVDFSDEDSENEEISFFSNNQICLRKSNHPKLRKYFLEDCKEEEEEEETGEKKINEQGKEEGAKEYLYTNKKVGKNNDDFLNEKESYKEFDLIEKYGLNDEIMVDSFQEGENENLPEAES